MMYALQAEGEYERFSRNNRASAQRIRSLVVQAPETKIQKNIIDELKALDDKINGQNAEIEKYDYFLHIVSGQNLIKYFIWRSLFPMEYFQSMKGIP